MNTRRGLIAWAGALLAFGLLELLLFRPAAGPLRLVLVRRVRESDRPAAFFRVEGGGGRRLQITAVDVLVVDPFGIYQEKPVFGVRGWPGGNPDLGRAEFDVLAPTNAAVWKVQVGVQPEAGNLLYRLVRETTGSP
ncbi:MAG: hypothetical protein KGS61_12565 [Verrucomicrobia bacterium]|nr:hypothetical protein [Verrucomicrobiota bacterium]